LPQQAGTLVTLFLLGAVGSNLFCAPRFQRCRRGSWRRAALPSRRWRLPAWLPPRTTDDGRPACWPAWQRSALSVTHGTVGLSVNPHRMFAMCGMALGVFAIVFRRVPEIVAVNGGAALFVALALIMLTASASSALLFPRRAGMAQAAQPLAVTRTAATTRTVRPTPTLPTPPISARYGWRRWASAAWDWCRP
jgi:hypothetical protein